jgi:MFS family permease
MFIAGIALFTVASLATGLAQSPDWMIGARAVQGIGAAVLAPATLALLSTNFPEGRERTRAMAAYGAVHHLGGAVGLGILVTVFDAAGSPDAGARELLARSG